MDELQALIAKEAAAAASLCSIGRLVWFGVIAIAGSVLAIVLFPTSGILPIGLLAITFGIVTVVLGWTRRAQLARVRRQRMALELPTARVLRE